MSECALLLALLLAGCQPFLDGERRIAKCCEPYDAGGESICLSKVRAYTVSPAEDIYVDDHYICGKEGWKTR